MTNNRAAVVTAFVAGAMLVAVAVVVYGGPAPTVEKSLAEKKAMLKAALRHRAMQQLDSITFGAQDFGNTGTESGNKGDEWNYGANFGGANAKALAHDSFYDNVPHTDSAVCTCRWFSITREQQ